MTKRWQNRPAGSNWGEFGEDDQRGRLNLLTAGRRLAALKEVKTGEVFCLSHPLDKPGGSILNSFRKPPEFHAVMREGRVYFNLAMAESDPRYTDVGSDEAIMLYSQYSTHWDGFAHKGTLFDADGDGVAEKVSYNGFRLVDGAGRGLYGELGAVALSVAEMAATGVQGRAVMIDLRHHFGDERVDVTWDMLERVMKDDAVTVEKGDILCLHTGLGPIDPRRRTAGSTTRSRRSAACSTATTSGCTNGSPTPASRRSPPTTSRWKDHPRWAPIRASAIAGRSCRCTSTAWSSWASTWASCGT